MNNFKERYDELFATFDNVKNENINLEEAGIKELNTKIGELVELENNVKGLAKDIKNNDNDDDLVSDGELLGHISEFIVSMNDMSKELRDAQRDREKLRNRISVEKGKLSAERDEFDFKINDALVQVDVEAGVLGSDLTDEDRNYHEELKRVHRNYINALNEARKPIDELYDKYDAELNLLLNGGKPNFKLEDNELVEVEAEEASFPEIKDEDVVSNVHEDEEALEEPVETKLPIEDYSKEDVETKKVKEENSEDIDLIRKEVEEELKEDKEEETEEVKPVSEELDESTDYLAHPTLMPLEETKEEKEDTEEMVNPFDSYFEPEHAKEEMPVETKEESENLEPETLETPLETEEAKEEVEDNKFDMLAALKNLRNELDDLSKNEDTLEHAPVVETPTLTDGQYIINDNYNIEKKNNDIEKIDILKKRVVRNEDAKEELIAKVSHHIDAATKYMEEFIMLDEEEIVPRMPNFSALEETQEQEGFAPRM